LAHLLLRQVCAASDWSTTCNHSSDCPPAAAPNASEFVEHTRSNCAGQCLPADDSGNCDRMPGCGHDRQLPYCEPEAMMARCLAARPYKGVNCSAFNTNGYLYHGTGVSSFGAYPLSCWTLEEPTDPKCIAALSPEPSSHAGRVIAIAEDLDRILSSDPHFSMASWVGAARAFGGSDEEKQWLEWNARLQVTSWGSLESNGNNIGGYASKQWGGLVSGYHLPLWKRFFDRMHTAAASGPLPQQAVYTELAQLGAAWVNATNAIPGLSGEDSVAVASELLAKWDPGH